MHASRRTVPGRTATAGRDSGASTKPGRGEIAVAVEAWGVNFIDLLAGEGLHPGRPGNDFVPGHEIAGRVIACGPGTAHFSSGDRVMAVVRSGGYAPEVCCPAEFAMHVPGSMDFAGAAASMVTGLTAVACVEDAARVRSGDRLLVQAAAGATGLACAQLAAWHGAEVLGTASLPEKTGFLERQGFAALHHAPGTLRQELERAGRSQVDAVIDSRAGPAIAEGLAVLRDGGRYVEIGRGDALPWSVT